MSIIIFYNDKLAAVQEQIKLFENHRTAIYEQMKRNEHKQSLFTLMEEKQIITTKLKELYGLEKQYENKIQSLNQ
jgi:hypothetical protein